MASRSPKSAKRSTKKSGASQVPPTRATSPSTATGQAIRDAEGTTEIPKGKDRGSKVEIVGNPKPDLVGDPAKPEGAQAEPARFTSNGQAPHNMVGSPSGPVPVSSITSDAGEAERIQQAANESHDNYVEARLNPKKLSPETISRLGRSELQSIGQQRGYEGFGPEVIMGTRRARLAFQKAQDEDKNLKD